MKVTILPEYLKESWRLEVKCCHSNSCEKPSAKTDVKNSQGVNNNIGYVVIAIKQLFV